MREDGADPRQCAAVRHRPPRASRSASSAPSSAAPTIPSAATPGRWSPRRERRRRHPARSARIPKAASRFTLRDGRFGPYVQLGEAENGEKPKRASIPKGTDPATLDFETALKLLALPREIGTHPESGEPIVAGIGRFGPYVKHQKDYANLEDGDDVLTVGINRAVTLLAEKKARGGKGGRRGRPAGKVLGQHPAGGAVTQHDGRYGPYVSLQQDQRDDHFQLRPGDDHAR